MMPHVQLTILGWFLLLTIVGLFISCSCMYVGVVVVQRLSKHLGVCK